MKVPTVRVTGLGPGASDRVVGFVAFVGGKVIASNEAVEYIATVPLQIGDDIIDPKEEPERFLRSLHLEYRSAYCTAEKALDMDESVTVKTT